MASIKSNGSNSLVSFNKSTAFENVAESPVRRITPRSNLVKKTPPKTNAV